MIEFKKQLTLKGFTQKTIKAYRSHSKLFLEYINKKENELTKEDFEDYMIYLLNIQNNSHSYVNQAISSIKILYKDVLKQGDLIYHIPRPKKEKKLPNILSEDEVIKILEAVDNYKHRAILFLIYSAGLRVGEVVRLKLEDIDSKRMLVHVKIFICNSSVRRGNRLEIYTRATWTPKFQNNRDIYTRFQK